MFGTTNYPFNFSNRRGIPMLESTSVEVTDTNVVLNLPNRAFRGLNDHGIILFRHHVLPDPLCGEGAQKSCFQCGGRDER